MHFEFWIPNSTTQSMWRGMCGVLCCNDFLGFLRSQSCGTASIVRSQAVFHNITRTRLYFIIPHKKAVYDVIHEGGTTRGSDNEGVALVYVESSSSYDCHGAPRARGKEGLQQTGRRQTSPPRFRKGRNQTSFSI